MFENLNIKKIDKNDPILLSLRLQSFREVGDKSKEGKDHITCDLDASVSSGDYKKVIDYFNQLAKTAKEKGDRLLEGVAYGELGNVFLRVAEFRRAVNYYNLLLHIAKDVGHAFLKGTAYNGLGNAYQSLCDFKKAIEYHNLRLEIAKEIGDKRGEGEGYGHLGNAYFSLGDFDKAIEYHNLHLKKAKEVGDTHGMGMAYGNLGIAYRNLGDFEETLKYHNLRLKIAKKEGDKLKVGIAYGNLGNAHHSLGNFKKAIEYYNLRLTIAKEVGDKLGEGNGYGNLGSTYFSLGDFTKAKESYELLLKFAKKVEDKSMEAAAHYSLAGVFVSLGPLSKAVEHLQASITLYNALRILLKSKDEWKVNFRNRYQMAYTELWRVLVEQGKIDEALFAAEKGRAQALTDLMESSFCGGRSHPKGDNADLLVLKNIPSNTVFQAVDKDDVNLWVVSEGKQVHLRESKLKVSVSENSGVSQSFESFLLGVYTQLGVRSNVRCENRSLDALRKSRPKVDKKTRKDTPLPLIQQNEFLSTLYDIIMKPVADLVVGDELLIVPDGPLWLVPYAALKDGSSNYVCESFTIRLAPSLTSLKLIADCPEDYHKSSGALLVGDPWVTDIPWVDSEGERIFEQIPCAKKEVEMIGKILNVAPLTGRKATKREVLKRLSSVALVHFAAHGSMDTGEIALAPDPMKAPSEITEEDFILTIGEVLDAQLRAKLVVLSCCHSAQGKIKAEGVVGIARAFIGAGARSVVVSLWAINDGVTFELMKCFYHHLAEGKRASESLNLAMKSLRESDEFSDFIHWAPFMLIGDDFTLDFSEKKGENL